MPLRKRRAEMTTIVESTGDVFRDIGFSRTEAANLKLRADLMLELRQVIKTRNLTQIEAAKLFDVTQPRVSDIVRGKIHLFTIDTLVTMLARAGVATRVVPDRRVQRTSTFVELPDIERKFIETWQQAAAALVSAYTPEPSVDEGPVRSDADLDKWAWHAAEYPLCA
jgi:predicted XRE-type DNA-binding protein